MLFEPAAEHMYHMSDDSLVQTVLENFSVFKAAEVLEIARAVANAGVMPPWIQTVPLTWPLPGVQ